MNNLTKQAEHRLKANNVQPTSLTQEMLVETVRSYFHSDQQVLHFNT